MARTPRPILLALALVLAAATPLACRGAADQSVTAVGPAVLTNCFTNAELFGFETSFAAEVTNGLNYTQMGSFPTQDYGEEDFLAVPAEETKPWLSKTGATVYKIPSFAGKCWNTSVPYFSWSECDGAASPGACIVADWPLANATWMVIGQLLCTGGYPSPLPEGGDNTPPAGNITLVLTNQCSQYTYTPDPSKAGSDSYYVLTDEWGARYAHQGVENGLPEGEEAWAEFMAGVELPPGWKLERVPLTEEETHMVYLVGDACLLAIVIDNLGNRYHQLTYDVPFTEGLLGHMECPATGAVPSNVLDKLLTAPLAAKHGGTHSESAAEGPPTPATPSEQQAAADFDCSVCHDVLVDPIVCPCGHDLCLSCYYEVWVAGSGSIGSSGAHRAQRGSSRALCPPCRAPLPSQPPAVCVRLRAAVEAVAGERVAARRTELAQREGQRRLQEALADAEVQRRACRQLEQRLQAARAEVQASQMEAAALEGEASQLRRTVASLQGELADVRRQLGDASEPATQACIQLKERLAALLPFPPPHGTPDERSCEESRWLCYQRRQHPDDWVQQLPLSRSDQPGAPASAPWVAVGAASVACGVLLGALLVRGSGR